MTRIRFHCEYSAYIAGCEDHPESVSRIITLVLPDHITPENARQYITEWVAKRYKKLLKEELQNNRHRGEEIEDEYLHYEIKIWDVREVDKWHDVGDF